jgi:hypothetical protein
MNQLTVKQLYIELAEEIKNGNGDKFIVVADDNEGNAYHGMFYGVVSDPQKVKENIDCSNGLYDSAVTDYNKIVILG